MVEAGKHRLGGGWGEFAGVGTDGRLEGVLGYISLFVDFFLQFGDSLVSSLFEGCHIVVKLFWTAGAGCWSVNGRTKGALFEGNCCVFLF